MSILICQNISAGCKYLGVFSKVLLCNPLEAGLNSVLRLLKNLLTHIHQTHLVSCLCRHLCVCVCVCVCVCACVCWGGIKGASQHAQAITDSQLLRRGPSFPIFRVSGHRLHYDYCLWSGSKTTKKGAWCS